MHFDTSISFATSTLAVWRDAAWPSTDGRAADDVEAIEMLSWFVLLSMPPAPVMGSMSTRNALYSGVSMLASPTKGVSELGPKPFCAAPVKPQWSGMPTMCTVLPSHVQRLDALGDDRLGLDRAALRPHPHPAAVLDALLLRQLLGDLDEELRLQDRVDLDVLGPEVEVLGQPVGRRRIGELLRRRRTASMSPLNTRAAGLPRIFGAIGLATGDLERLVVRRERPVAHHAAREQARGALRVHDEGPDHVRLGRRRDVGHVVAGPLRAVPLDQLAARDPTACPAGRPRRDCRGCGGWPARRTPSSR